MPTIKEVVPAQSATTAVAESKAAPAKKSYTNWDAFAKAGLRPVTVQCQAYQPYHRSDQSCHTNIVAKPESIAQHIAAGHSGAFKLTLKKADGPSATGLKFWAELAASGLEAHDFRCDICDKELRFHPTSILACLRAHNGKTRRVLPGGHYNVTFGLGRNEFTDQFMDEGDSD